MFVSTRWRGYWALIVLGIALLALPFLVSREYTHLAITLVILVVGTVALRLLFLSGRLTIGQNFFLMTGAYGAGFVILRLQLDPWIGLVAAAAISVLIALMLGLILLRVPGVYFSIATVALVLISTSAMRSFPALTGGDQGLTGIPGLAVGSLQFSTDPRILYNYYTMLAIGAISLAVMYRIERSPLGLLIRSLGGNDELAQHLGVSMLRYRMLVFCVGAAFCGLAGAFSSTYLHQAAPETFGLNSGLYLQIYAVVGGLTSFWGPIVGVLFIEGLVHSLRAARYVQPIIYGLILLLFFLWLRGGLLSLPSAARDVFRRVTGRGKQE